MGTTRGDIRDAAQALGLKGRPLEIHASLSSFGQVDDGAEAVVDGLLDAHCTLVVPTFSTGIHQLSPAEVPIHLRPSNNAEPDVTNDRASDGLIPVYDPSSAAMNRSEGAIAMTVAAHPDRVRGNHPLNSFAAVGPLANRIIQGQTATDVYAPLRQSADRNGVVLMMGTGLNKMTLIHTAEELAGRRPFVRWARDRGGDPIVCRVGGCSEGFERLAPFLLPHEHRATVGRSRWRIFHAANAMATAAELIRRDPEITRCGRSQCQRCSDAIAGGPV